MIKSTLLKRSMSGNVHGKHRRTMKREMLEKKSFEKLGWKKNGDYGQIDRDFLLSTMPSVIRGLNLDHTQKNTQCHAGASICRGVKLGKTQPRFCVPAEAKVSFIRKISKNPQNFKDLPHFWQFPAEAREVKEAVLYAPDR